MPYNPKIFEFVETPLFTKILPRYLDDDQYVKLQKFLNDHPETGVVVFRSGGMRKLRSGLEGRGKRGGLRVIYYLRVSRGQIWMATLYGKNVTENIPTHVLKELKRTI